MISLRFILLLQALVVIGFVVLMAVAPYPFPTSLLRWDAVWYDLIRADGYSFTPNKMSSTAFFPLFPLAWRFSGLGPLGISLANLSITAGTLYWLYCSLKLRRSVVLLFAAFPSSMFLYLPYSEALFFFFSSAVLLAVARRYQRPVGLAAALFGGALLRVTAFCYLPALVIVEGAEWLKMPGTFWARARWLLGFGLLTGAGLFSVVVYQWYQTGVWFAFNKAEVAWHHHFQLPRLPFISSLDNDGALWLDGLGLLVGVAALGWVVHSMVQVARQQHPDPLVLFSATYVAATMVVTLSSAPIEAGHSSLMSLHRYVFCNPFFLVLLERFIPQRRVGLRPSAAVLGAVVVITATMGMLSLRQFDIEWPTSSIPFLWGPVVGFAYAVFVLLYALLWLQSDQWWAKAALYLSSLGMQLFFLYTYSVGHWVG